MPTAAIEIADRLKPPPSAADYLGVKEQTLAAWRCQRRGPAFIKVGRLIRYSVADLDAFLAQGRVEHPVAEASR